MCLWLPGKVKATKQPCLSVKFILRIRYPEACRLKVEDSSQATPTCLLCPCSGLHGGLAQVSKRTNVHVGSGSASQGPKLPPPITPA